MKRLTAKEWKSLEEGYYFFQYGNVEICRISGGCAHFFGQVSQELGNEFLAEYTMIGDRIQLPDVVPQ